MMDIESLHKQVAEMRKQSFENTPQITLGELWEQIKDLPEQWGSDKEDVTVDFDFGTAEPTDFSSWRGSYNEIALGYQLTGYDNEKNHFGSAKLKDFKKKVKKAIGSTHTGWKGGDFTMTKDTPVWVSNSGDVGNTGVIGVLDDGWRVVILTAYCEY